MVLEDERGHRGLGEASPLPGYGPETLADVDAALRGLSGRFESSFAWPDRFGDPLPSVLTDVASPAARFALETALWDLWSQQRGLPLAAAWGADPALSVATAVLVDLMAPAWPHRSPAAIKVKVGRAGEWPTELRALRSLGQRYPDTPIRIDANQAFSTAEVSDRLAEIEGLLADDSLRIEFIEEPSAPEWPKQSGLTLGRDESLQGRAPNADVIGDAVAVLKPTVLGGLEAVRGWAAVARKTVVSHTFEGPIAHAAASAWALAFASDVVAGLGPHSGLTAWDDITPGHVDGDRLVVSDRPGLGYRREPA